MPTEYLHIKVEILKLHIQIIIIKEMMNDIDAKIQYTFESSTDSIDNSVAYLDCRVIISQNGTIDTDIYAKKTDTFNYLPFNSAHPRHVMRNIPYSLARRIRGIVSKEELIPIRMKEMADRLTVKKYPKKLIDDAINRAMNTTRDSILYPNSNANGNIQPQSGKSAYCVSTFNAKFQHPGKSIQPYVDLFNNTRTDESQKLNIKFSFRKSPSLKDLLMFRKQPHSNKVIKCSSQCTLCTNNLHSGNELKLNSGFTLHPNADFDCMSRNLEYIMVCGGCKEYYIGETGDTLRNRMTVHRQQSAEHCSFVPVKADQHFRTCGKGNYKVFPFYKPRYNTTIYRRVQEERWQRILKPKLNNLQ